MSTANSTRLPVPTAHSGAPAPGIETAGNGLEIGQAPTHANGNAPGRAKGKEDEIDSKKVIDCSSLAHKDDLTRCYLTVTATVDSRRR